MKNLSQVLNLTGVLVAAGLLAGCASTKTTDRHELVTGKIPKPAHIWVYNFASTAREAPMESTFASAATAPQSPATKAFNERMGLIIATNIVAEINQTGMSAALMTADTRPAVNDLLIQGYLLSVNQGSEAKRVLVGFGDGASSLAVAVEGYEMTEAGMRKLGYGTVDAGGGKSPGAALGVVGLIATHNPAGLIISGGVHVYGEATGSSKVEGRAKATAKEIVAVLKQRFIEQGWINP